MHEFEFLLRIFLQSGFSREDTKAPTVSMAQHTVAFSYDSRCNSTIMCNASSGTAAADIYSFSVICQHLTDGQWFRWHCSPKWHFVYAMS